MGAWSIVAWVELSLASPRSPLFSFLLIYAWKRRRRYSAKKQVLGVCLVESVEVRVWGGWLLADCYGWVIILC